MNRSTTLITCHTFILSAFFTHISFNEVKSLNNIWSSISPNLALFRSLWPCWLCCECVACECRRAPAQCTLPLPLALHALSAVCIEIEWAPKKLGFSSWIQELAICDQFMTLEIVFDDHKWFEWNLIIDWNNTYHLIYFLLS